MGSEGPLQVGNVLESTLGKSTAVGSLSARPELFFLEHHMRAREAEWRAFVQAAGQGCGDACEAADGFNALVVAETATLSARGGRAVNLEDGRPLST